jgi:TonB-dependent SusC/RagA subfamily outer membrane receptor
VVVASLVLGGRAFAQQVRVDHDSASRVAERDVPAALTIVLDSLDPKPLGTLPNVLSSRLPGVLVEQPSGATGAGERIRIRGINSLLLPGDPLVIVDGVRVANATTISTVDVGGQVPSLLDALDPEEIERIEVLSGPASAAMYGGDAQDGVILITTRRGRPGRLVWRLHTQYGAINDRTTYPANFGRVGTDPSTGQPVASCTLDLESQGGCVPGPLTTWNPLENASPFHAGTQQRHGLSVSGGTRSITYYMAGDYDREDGVYADNEQLQTHTRGTLTGRVGRTLDLGLSANYTDGMTRLPIAGMRAFGAIGAGLFGAAVDNPVTRGYDLDSLALVLHDMGPPEHAHQYTLGIDAEWRPLDWLRSTSMVGFDRVHLSSDERDTIGLPVGGPAGGRTISRTTAVYRTDVLTVQNDWEASYGSASSLSASSVVGVRYHRGRMYDRYENVIGTPTEGPGVYSSSMSQTHGDASTTGLYVEQRFAWRQRLFLTGVLRRDRVYHTLVTPTGEAPSLTDASVNLSWLISDEPFFPRASWLDELRLRGGYGRVARYLDEVIMSPGLQASLFAFTPVSPFGPPQPVEPTPQRTRETEAGLDATLFHRRLSAAVTYYDKRSTQVAVLSSLAPPGSLAPVLQQDGAALRNRGYEMLLSGAVLRTSSVTADITLTGAANSNSIDDLNVPTLYVPGYPMIQPVQLLAPGHPAAQYWGRRITFADANGDGIISRYEVRIDSTRSFLGGAIPARELSITPTLTLFRRVTLSALLDYRGGFEQYDANDAVRCATVSFRNCRAVYDPTAPLAEQAAAIASRIEVDSGQLDDAPYVYDASFWKLREVSITLAAPRRWTERVAASDVRLTLAGRNLGTWTSYPGLDPEINATPSDALLRGDFSTQPPVRYLTARVDVTW